MHILFSLLFLFIPFTSAQIYKRQEDGVIQESAESDESSTPVNQNIYNTKSIFSTEPSIVDVTEFVQTQLYCDVDPILCKKVEYALTSAAERFSKVVNLKTKIV